MEAMVPRLWDEIAIQGLEDPTEMTDLFVNRGRGYTAIVDDNPIAAAGIVILWPGMGEAWAITTNNVERYPLFFHKAVSWGLNEIIQTERLRRVEASVVEGHEKAVKWLLRLGFEFEGRMPLYGPAGQTHLRFAKLDYSHLAASATLLDGVGR